MPEHFKKNALLLKWGFSDKFQPFAFIKNNGLLHTWSYFFVISCESRSSSVCNLLLISYNMS